MTRKVCARVAMAVLVVAGPLSGCSDDASTSSSSSSSTAVSVTAPVPPASSSACSGDTSPPTSARFGEADLELTVEPTGVLVQGQTSWALTVRNTGDAAIELIYPTTQDGDVTLRGADGDEAYRWSRGSVFQPVRRCQVVPPGRETTSYLGGVLRVPAGMYRLRATVAATPAPRPFVAVVSVLSE